MLQGVIFDMDGLMFDTEPIWGSCWGQVIAEYGYEMPDGLLDKVRGCSGDTICTELRCLLGEDVPAEAIWERERRLACETLLEQGAPKKPGLDDLLEYLHDLVLPMAVASASPKDVILNNLRTAGLERYFDVLVSGEDLDRGKPDPLIFLETSERLGTRPAKTLVLEDSANGVTAAHRGGFMCVMVPDLERPSAEVEAMTNAVVGSLDQVIDLMETDALG